MADKVVMQLFCYWSHCSCSIMSALVNTTLYYVVCLPVNFKLCEKKLTIIITIKHLYIVDGEGIKNIPCLL